MFLYEPDLADPSTDTGPSNANLNSNVLGPAIKAARKYKRLSRRELARLAGVAELTITNIEQTGNAQLAVFQNVLDVLGRTLTGLPPDVSIGTWLRDMRVDRGLSQKRAATLAGITPPTVAKLEVDSGHVSSLTRLLAAYGWRLELRPDDEADRSGATSSFTVHNEDCRERMRLLVEQGIRFHSVITDPPYALTGVAKWDTAETAFDVELWRLAFSLLHPGGHLVAFAAPRRAWELARALDQAGFEIRDAISWITAGGVPWGNQHVSHDIDRHLGHERVVTGHQQLYGRKMTTADQQAARLFSGVRRDRPVSEPAKRFDGFGSRLKPQHETIVIARRPLSEPSLAENVLKTGTGALNIDACRVPGAASVRREPSHPSSDKIRLWEPHAKGRWPGNVVAMGFDHMPWAKFYHAPKPRGDERWGHDCAKPVSLLRILARLVTPPQGVILDPFAGAGSVGEAALRESFGYCGIELDPAHAATMQRRLSLTAFETTA